MGKHRARVAVSLFVASALAAPAAAHAPSGAIFTTLGDGSEVNFNIFPSKESVHLDGGPGPGAPQDAAGLDDGTYVFQVTDPSGKTLLSTDAARCRQVVALGGIFTQVVDTNCEHDTGNDVDHPPAITVQLMPYDDSPNHGGVYKAWVTRVEDFLLGCQALGFPGSTGLDVVDCGNDAGNRHGFIPAHSKTDNFKVRETDVNEIDTRFFDDDYNPLLGRSVTWTDTLEVQNTKWSYYEPELQINNEAHVEAPEVGTHLIRVDDQPGCTVHEVILDGVLQGLGPTTVAVRVRRGADRNRTWFIDVFCHQ